MPERPLWEQYRAQIDALASLPLNFDLQRRHEYTEANGWHVDDYHAELPGEPAGPPLPAGSWALARRILQEYRFPDPNLVTGIYLPDQPLAQRVMLLCARAFGLTFYFGVRVGGVVDDTFESDEGPLRAWGFNYQTLKGHFERGQMDFTALKWLQSGRVAFRIHAFSQPAAIANPVFRLGFHLFGRRVQRRFALRSLERMQQLVGEELRAQATGAPRPAPPAPEVLPASATPETAARLERIHQDETAGRPG